MGETTLRLTATFSICLLRQNEEVEKQKPQFVVVVLEFDEQPTKLTLNDGKAGNNFEQETPFQLLTLPSVSKSKRIACLALLSKKNSYKGKVARFRCLSFLKRWLLFVASFPLK